MGYEKGYLDAKDKFEQIGFDNGFREGTETQVTKQVNNLFEGGHELDRFNIPN